MNCLKQGRWVACAVALALLFLIAPAKGFVLGLGAARPVVGGNAANLNVEVTDAAGMPAHYARVRFIGQSATGRTELSAHADYGGAVSVTLNALTPYTVIASGAEGGHGYVDIALQPGANASLSIQLNRVADGDFLWDPWAWRYWLYADSWRFLHLHHFHRLGIVRPHTIDMKKLPRVVAGRGSGSRIIGSRGGTAVPVNGGSSGIVGKGHDGEGGGTVTTPSGTGHVVTPGREPADQPVRQQPVRQQPVTPLRPSGPVQSPPIMHTGGTVGGAAAN